MRALWSYFLKIIFQNIEHKEVVKSFIFFSISIMMLTFIFDNYYYWKKKLESYFFYDYIKIIFCMKYSIRQKEDFLCDKYHPSFLSKVQQLSTTLECNTLVAFIRLLFINKSAKNVIRRRHPKTNTRQNDVALILLALFVLWNQLSEKFYSYGTILKTYLDYC